ncbi:hypothetical protein [Candidatus Kuenenia sp.]
MIPVWGVRVWEVGAVIIVFFSKEELMGNDKDGSSVVGVMASTGTGAVAGAGGAVTAVAVGGVSGLGATGITSGLAAVGTVVGGGMAAGLAVVAAAPIAAAGAGYGVYKLVKWLRRKRN